MYLSTHNSAPNYSYEMDSNFQCHALCYDKTTTRALIKLHFLCRKLQFGRNYVSLRILGKIHLYSDEKCHYLHWARCDSLCPILSKRFLTRAGAMYML